MSALVSRNITVKKVTNIVGATHHCLTPFPIGEDLTTRYYISRAHLTFMELSHDFEGFKANLCNTINVGTYKFNFSMYQQI